MLRAVLLSVVFASPALADARSDAARTICLNIVTAWSKQGTSITEAMLDIARAHAEALAYAEARPGDESAAAYAEAMSGLIKTAIPHLGEVTEVQTQFLQTLRPLCITAATPE